MVASSIFLRQHQLPFRLFLRHRDIMFRLFVGVAAKDKPHCILKIGNAHIFLHKLDDVPGFPARKLVVSPPMLEQVQPAAVLHMDGVPVALLNLISMFYGKINQVGIKDLPHLLLCEGHRAFLFFCVPLHPVLLPIAYLQFHFPLPSLKTKNQEQKIDYYCS